MMGTTGCENNVTKHGKKCGKMLQKQVKNTEKSNETH